MLKITVILTALLISSCNPWLQVGGPCDYKKIHGMATVTQLKKVVDPLCSQQAMHIYFTFVADTSAADPQASSIPEQLYFLNTTEFPVEWLKKQGVKVGAKYRMTKDVITKGACSPVGYIIPDLVSNKGKSISEMCSKAK